MKKLLIFTLALGIGISAMAQQVFKFKDGIKELKKSESLKIGIEPLKSIPMTKSNVKQEIITPINDRETNIVNIIPLGTSANAYGFSGSQESPIPVRTDLNTIAFIHRMGGDDDPDGYSGDMGYDVSLDGGATWTTSVEFHEAIDNDGGDYYKDAARYPSAGIANPEGGSGSYLTYYIPLLWGGNGIWGGYAVGVANFTNPSLNTSTYITYDENTDFMVSVPYGYAISSQGLSIGIDEDYDIDATTYNGNTVLTKGYWDNDAQDFVYTLEALDTPLDVSNGSADQKVAFSLDGEIGYITLIGNDGEAEQMDGRSNYYPIYYKTTDGGLTWEGPSFVQLDGPNGINGIVNNHLTDEQIELLFEAPVPAREDISYTMGFDHDIAVDNNGNLHIAVLIAPTGDTPQSIIYSSPFTAIVDLFTTDGGTSWFVEEMGRPLTFRGEFGEISSDNRVKITQNEDATKFFFSWLDTDTDGAVDNDSPNIWSRGFIPSTYMKTANISGEDAPTNVTKFSPGMWQSFYGTAAKYCFTNDNGYNIPFVYQQMDPADPTTPVRFQYIQDFYFTDADFTVQGINDPIENTIVLSSVSQNFPNPFNNESYVTVNLNEGSDLSLEVYTLTGQLVSAKEYGYKVNGTHTITINGNDLTSGIYFYTVTAGENKITRKMIVE